MFFHEMRNDRTGRKPTLFMTVRREIAELRSVAPIAPGEQWVPGVEPGDWLRRLRRCLSRCGRKGDKPQVERGLSPNSTLRG